MDQQPPKFVLVALLINIFYDNMEIKLINFLSMGDSHNESGV